jgi:hypothetical protein
VGHYTNSIYANPASYPSAIANLSTMQNGTIVGRIRVTLTGGSIVIDPATVIFYNSIAVTSSSHSPRTNITASPLTFTAAATATVPTVSEWGLRILAIAMVLSALRRMRESRKSLQA